MSLVSGKPQYKYPLKFNIPNGKDWVIWTNQHKINFLKLKLGIIPSYIISTEFCKWILMRTHIKNGIRKKLNSLKQTFIDNNKIKMQIYYTERIDSQKKINKLLPKVPEY